MPTAIVDDPTAFPSVTTPAGADVPNAASLQITTQQLANRTANLNRTGSIFIASMLAGTWFKESSGVATDIRAVISNSPGNSTLGLVVAVGAKAVAPPLILTSLDGQTWTSQTAVGTATTLLDVASNGTLVLAVSVGNTTNSIQGSSNGTLWTTRTGAISLANTPSICWSPTLSLWVIAQGGGAGGAETSPDGTTWTSRTVAAGGGGGLIGVTFGNGIAMAYDSTTVYTSSTGTGTWVTGGSASSSSTSGPRMLIYTGIQWILASQTLNGIVSSSLDNGATWKYRGDSIGGGGGPLPTSLVQTQGGRPILVGTQGMIQIGLTMGIP